MKILLINPPNNLNRVLGNAKVFIGAFEPMGLLYIAAILENNGHEVKVLDAFLENYDLKQIGDIIKEYRPEVVGITCLTSTGSLTYEIGKMIKKKYPSVKVVLGNIHASIFSKAFLENRIADAVVHGEGEYTMLGLVESFEKKKSLRNVAGISWWDGKRIVNNPLRPPVKDLDDIPMPARHLVPQEKYSANNISNFIYINKTKKLMKQMMTSRGCVFQCKFCVVHNQRHYRAHSPKRAVDEMELLVRKYNAGYIFFMDPLFIADKKRTIEICKEIIKRKLDFKWGCECHVKVVDLALLRQMEKAGCYEVHFGIESGVQRLLDNVNKGTTLEQIGKAVNLVKKTGIKVSGLFMLGLPGETKEDSLKTIKFACDLPLDFAQFSITVPYPGSQLFTSLSEQKKIETGIREDGTINPSVWERFSAYTSFTENKPIFLPDGMSIEELKSVQKLALRRFYLRPRQLIRQVQRFNFKDISRLFLAFKSVFID